MTRLFLRVLVWIVPLGACATVGPAALPRARFEYNETIASSWNEQLLLNLVRLRYRDTPVFLEVGSVLAQYALGASATLSSKVLVDGARGDEVGAAIGGTYEERPTITFVPMQGEDFTRRMLQSLTPETLLLLANSGWSISSLMLAGVQRLHDIRNLPRAAGPTPDIVEADVRFAELVGLLRDLQVAGGLDLAWTVTPDGVTVTRLMLQRSDPRTDAQLDRVRVLLGVPPDVTSVELVRGPAVRPDQVSIEGRSLLGSMFFFSHAVAVPPSHLEAGLATTTRGPDGAPFDWVKATGGLLQIVSSRSKPEGAFVAVPYRDHWFWIDDADLQSKSTFFLLTYLFSLQAAKPGGLAPALTVSSGR